MIEYELDNKYRLVIVRFRGKMVLSDITELLTDNRIAGNEENYNNILIDIRFTNTDGFSEMNESNHLENLINESKMFHHFFIVGSIDQLFSELGLNLRKHFNSNLKAFTSFNEAMDWIHTKEKV